MTSGTTSEMGRFYAQKRWAGHVKRTLDDINAQRRGRYRKKTLNPEFKSDILKRAGKWMRDLGPEGRREYFRQYRLAHLAEQRLAVQVNRAKWKHLIYDELGNACSICGGTNHLQRHHLDDSISGRQEHYGRAEYQRALSGEIVLLCRGCHLQISNLKAKIRRGQYGSLMTILKKSIVVPE